MRRSPADRIVHKYFRCLYNARISSPAVPTCDLHISGVQHQYQPGPLRLTIFITLLALLHDFSTFPRVNSLAGKMTLAVGDMLKLEFLVGRDHRLGMENGVSVLTNHDSRVSSSGRIHPRHTQKSKQRDGDACPECGWKCGKNSMMTYPSPSSFRTSSFSYCSGSKMPHNRPDAFYELHRRIA